MKKTSFELKWPLLFAALITLLAVDLFFGRSIRQLPYSEFKEALERDQVAEVTVARTAIRGQLKSRELFESIRVDDPELLRDLQAHEVKVSGANDSGLWWTLLVWGVPSLLLILWFTRGRLGVGGRGLLAVGQSKARVYVEKQIDVRFSDVAGVDEAKEELREVIDFLKTPQKFARLGGRLPKGILLVGPPGTGKTLLARAVAGEANVPFFSISGSEFVEMFVGVGAARVRDLFQQAKERAPCIIFIDELDALGKVRGAGPVAHEEREQTLNQLLVELDGFDPRVGVILMAATNRPEILDPALLRAGRFDRHVLVDRPDRAGRLAILRLHARKVRLESEEALDALAGMTVGMVGADLANIVNEAALLAARRGRERVSGLDLEEAVERVIAGLQKHNRVLTPKERERVAFHECGHALVAKLVPGADAVKKISIVPRGISALGYTMQVPTEDRFLLTRSELENKLAVLFGGRVGEELALGEISTGAQDDLRKAAEIARSMVRAYGMGRDLEHLSFDRESRSPFLDNPPSLEHDYGSAVAREIDAEIRRILDMQYGRARKILAPHLDLLHQLAQRLLAEETLPGEVLDQLLAEPRVRSAPAAQA